MKLTKGRGIQPFRRPFLGSTEYFAKVYKSGQTQIVSAFKFVNGKFRKVKK